MTEAPRDPTQPILPNRLFTYLVFIGFVMAVCTLGVIWWATDAYGERRDEMVFDVNRSQLPDGMEPEVGQHLQTQAEGGHPLILEIIAVDENSVTLDGNHPLAGKDLNFDIELMEIA